MYNTVDNRILRDTFAYMPKLVAVRLPDDVYNAVIRTAEAEERSQSQVIVMGLRLAFGLKNTVVANPPILPGKTMVLRDRDEAASSGVPAGGEMPHGARKVRTKSQAGVSGEAAGDEKGDGPSLTTTGIPVSGGKLPQSIAENINNLDEPFTEVPENWPREAKMCEKHKQPKATCTGASCRIERQQAEDNRVRSR